MSIDLVLHLPEVDALRSTYAVVEHYQPGKDGSPPRCVFVAQCKLMNVYDLTYAKTNSRWVEIFGEGGPLIIRIVHVTRNKLEAARVCAARRDAHNPRPECNLIGLVMFRKMRVIKCHTDGQIYRTQADAAAALGVKQATVSLHLRGLLLSCGGHLLEYVQDETPTAAQVPALRKMAE